MMFWYSKMAGVCSVNRYRKRSKKLKHCHPERTYNRDKGTFDLKTTSTFFGDIVPIPNNKRLIPKTSHAIPAKGGDKMKPFIFFMLSVLLIVFSGLLPVFSSPPTETQDTAVSTPKSSEEITWECPIAAGVWYPSDGAVPENPMRYYRVRCWPGCHTGSSLGKYPDKILHDKPIWPTSTINGHSDMSSAKD